MANKIVGLVVSTSKKGTTGTTLHLTGEHDAYQRENANKCEGVAVTTEYIRGDYSNLKLGQSVNLIYNKGFEDKAILAEIIPVADK